MLYSHEILSFGKAAERAALSLYFFSDLTGERNIPRHYTEDDLAHAVSNSSPISNRSSIGRLDHFQSEFPLLWIPTAVARELNPTLIR